MLAAAATFAVLYLLDPLHRRDTAKVRSFATVPGEVYADQSTAAAADDAGGVQPPRDFAELAWQDSLDQVSRRLAMEASPRLRDAWQQGLRDERDPLSQWLDPRNAVVLMRLDHELRSHADLRAAALREHGGLVAVDRRVQQLAEQLADELLAGSADGAEHDLTATAWGVRALISAGSTPDRAAALRLGGDRLAAALPNLHGERLIAALTALSEFAAISGQHYPAVAEHGRRLVAEVLQPNDENWSRRLPDLLSDRVVPSTLGDASRLLLRLPAFGADANHCLLVRRLLLGELRKRRDGQDERPEVLAALLYGSADLLDDDERVRIEYELRRWKPARLAPDYTTLQQIAWGSRPGWRGFTRLQGELRQLALLPMPASFAARAAFCLCLATDYAGYPGALLPAAMRRS
jgi:hypothetical protein